MKQRFEGLVVPPHGTNFGSLDCYSRIIFLFLCIHLPIILNIREHSWSPFCIPKGGPEGGPEEVDQ